MFTEPRSADSELESVEGDDGDGDYSDLVPYMRDDTEELADNDNSDTLEPSDRHVYSTPLISVQILLNRIQVGPGRAF